MHGLADEYDCPALKWEAWRVVKETVGQFGVQPMQVLGGSLEGEDEGECDGEGSGGEEESEEGGDGDGCGDGESDDGFTSSSSSSSSLPPAKATVMAWARRLQSSWTQCEPVLTSESSQALTLLKGRLPYEFYRDRLAEFYSRHNPAKVEEVEAIMERWEGKEDELLRAVVDKYKARVEREGAEVVLERIRGKGIGVDEFEKEGRNGSGRVP